jgi:hypothetical protein
MICKKCLCNYELDDFDPNLLIPNIMKEKGFCFNCAYWSYRHQNLYHLPDFKRPEDLGYVETKLATLTIADTLQVVDNNFEMITLHINRPAPINMNQQPIYQVQGKEGTYLFNVNRVTFQGKISLKEHFIPNAICLDNDVALELIDRQSTKIINHLYYKL